MVAAAQAASDLNVINDLCTGEHQDQQCVTSSRSVQYLNQKIIVDGLQESPGPLQHIVLYSQQHTHSCIRTKSPVTTKEEMSSLRAANSPFCPITASPCRPAADWLRQLHQVLMEGEGWVLHVQPDFRQELDWI